MRPNPVAITAFGVLAAIACAAPSSPARAQQTTHPIPQSIALEHADTLARLTTLAKRRPPVGPAAREALALFKTHLAHEEAFILPPLTLVQALADGKVTPEMRWAIVMTDKLKSEQEEVFLEHTRITEAMNKLAEAARAAHDTEALEFAQSAVGDSLNDMELLEPMSLVIGEYLRAKLPPSP